MRPVRQATESEVWEHWKRIENHSSPDFRSDIRDPLPKDLTWLICEIEPHDIDRLFIISSDDWSDISGGTFRVAEVASRLDLPSSNKDTLRIASDINKKLNFIDTGGHLDSQLVSITDRSALSGPFTILEGNRRCVTFLLRGVLVGTSIFVGYSPAVDKCVWTRHTYR